MVSKLLLSNLLCLIIVSAIAQQPNKPKSRYIPVPNLIGMSFKKAELEAKKRGLSFGAIICDPDVKNIKSGIILWQNPEPKTESGKQAYIKRGGLVDLRLGMKNRDTSTTGGYNIYPNN